MTTTENSAFQNLLAAWRRREDARSTGTFADLGRARIELDDARFAMHAARHTTLR